MSVNESRLRQPPRSERYEPTPGARLYLLFARSVGVREAKQALWPIARRHAVSEAGSSRSYSFFATA